MVRACNLETDTQEIKQRPKLSEGNTHIRNNMEAELIKVEKAEMLQAINRAEVDIQISTAKQYPRDLTAVLNKIKDYATMDQETAEDCFYQLKRKDKDGNDSLIEGLSIRMAEIIASAWGNLRIQTRIVGNDGKMITAQAMCHDLESNLAVCKEVSRSITTKKGYTFSQDMQIVTGNAASSIAFRNAVLSVIPKAVTKKIITEVRKVALGQEIDLEQRRTAVIDYFGKLGVTQAQIFLYIGVKSIDEIGVEKLFELRAVANAIKEGTTTVQETFVAVEKEAKAQAAATQKATTAQDKAAAAMAKSDAITNGSNVEEAEYEEVDPETGEVKKVKKSTKK